MTRMQHAKRRRIIADRYANSNVMRPASMSGIQERATRFVAKCEESAGRSLDIFVSSCVSMVMSVNPTLTHMSKMCTSRKTDTPPW